MLFQKKYGLSSWVFRLFFLGGGCLFVPPLFASEQEVASEPFGHVFTSICEVQDSTLEALPIYYSLSLVIDEQSAMSVQESAKEMIDDYFPQAK